MLFVQVRVQMAFLPAITAVLLLQITMGTKIACSVVSSG